MTDLNNSMSTPDSSSFQPLTVIVGPTAAGKTALAVDLAASLGGEIISADSRQIYRELNLGTGKPSADELARVPHHLISEIDPRNTVTADQFANLARERMLEIFKRRQRVWVVGGTGLWIRALLDGLAPTPAPESRLRQTLRAQSREPGGAHTLYSTLLQVDPASAQRIHAHDLLRVIRALEVFHLTGEPLSKWQKKPGNAGWSGPVCWIGVSGKRDIIYARAEKRIDHWLATGWLNEVKALLASGMSGEEPALQALGYAHLVRYLHDKKNWEETVDTIKRDTRRYIKRQLTWFRANARIHWVDGSQSRDETFAAAMQLIR